jgi:hypothetical protein
MMHGQKTIKLKNVELLGALTKMRKATLSVVISARLSVCPSA